MGAPVPLSGSSWGLGRAAALGLVCSTPAQAPDREEQPEWAEGVLPQTLKQKVEIRLAENKVSLKLYVCNIYMKHENIDTYIYATNISVNYQGNSQTYGYGLFVLKIYP